MDTELTGQLGLCRPFTSGPDGGTCTGSAEYGHGLSLTTVHGRCCQAWDRAHAQAIRNRQADAEAGS
jgi:hypothetical protein